MGLVEEGTTVVSDAHARLLVLLARMGLEVLEEVEMPPYRPDVYVPDYHAVIELDGPQHSARADLKRDEVLLRQYRVPTLRIKPDELDDYERLRATVVTFLDLWADDAGARYARAAMRLPWL